MLNFQNMLMTNLQNYY